MIKISDILRYKEALESINFDASHKANLDIKNLIGNIDKNFSFASKNNLMKISASITMQENLTKKHYESEVARCKETIASIESTYLDLSNELYESAFRKENYLYRKEHRQISNSLESKIKNTIDKYADFKYAGLMLSPLFESLTHTMVAFDPLYLVDHDPSMLSTAISGFDSKYQHKIRDYEMNLRTNTDILPLKSISLVVAVNSFEQYNDEALRGVLKNIYSLLCPGGSVIFTFNNCDFSSGAKRVEEGFACYQTSKSVDILLEQLGFICITFTIHDEYQTIIEAKIPGILETVKTTPVLGQIIDTNRLDLEERNLYTSLLSEKK